jgi:hypothetical protein
MITQQEMEQEMYKKDEFKRQMYTPTISDSEDEENYVHGIGGSQALLVGPDY